MKKLLVLLVVVFSTPVFAETQSEEFLIKNRLAAKVGFYSYAGSSGSVSGLSLVSFSYQRLLYKKWAATIDTSYVFTTDGFLGSGIRGLQLTADYCLTTCRREEINLGKTKLIEGSPWEYWVGSGVNEKIIETNGRPLGLTGPIFYGLANRWSSANFGYQSKLSYSVLNKGDLNVSALELSFGVIFGF